MKKHLLTYKVMKSDVPGWVSVDEQVQRVELKLEYYYATIRALEDILKQVHQLSFNIKNVIQWRMFVAGSKDGGIFDVYLWQALR